MRTVFFTGFILIATAINNYVLKCKNEAMLMLAMMFCVFVMMDIIEFIHKVFINNKN